MKIVFTFMLMLALLLQPSGIKLGTYGFWVRESIYTTLELKKNNRFIFRLRPANGIGYDKKGRWKVMNDTLYLKDAQLKMENKDKYLIRGDTLWFGDDFQYYLKYTFE